MNRATWIVAGALAVAGCGDGAATAGGEAGGSPTAGFAPVEAPAKTMSVSDFLADVKAHGGRVALTGAVYSVDGPNSRFLLCDVAERECIGGT